MMPIVYRQRDAAPLEIMLESRYHVYRALITLKEIHQYLLTHPDLVGAWRGYSEDKRSDGWGFDYEKRRVFYDPGSRSAQQQEEVFDDVTQACAAYIKHEADSMADSIERLGGEIGTRRHLRSFHKKLVEVLNRRPNHAA